MNIKYLDSKHITRKIGTNLNNAIKNCSGDIIKPMCADDFFIDDNALEKIVSSFEGKHNKWLVTGCVHCQSIHFMYQQMIPYYQHKIHHGANTISSPSVLAMKTKDLFDENLSLLIDCEIYKRLYTNYGDPIIISDPMICNRMHDNQMQKIDADLIEKEKKYCINLYGE